MQSRFSANISPPPLQPTPARLIKVGQALRVRCLPCARRILRSRLFVCDGFHALVATLHNECLGGRHGAVCPLALHLSYEAKEDQVVGYPEFALVEWRQLLFDTPVQ